MTPASRRRTTIARRRLGAALLAVAALVVVVVIVSGLGVGPLPKPPPARPAAGLGNRDPFAYRTVDEPDFVARATAGNAQVLFTKSPAASRRPRNGWPPSAR